MPDSIVEARRDAGVVSRRQVWVIRVVSSIRAARRLNPNNRTTLTYVGGSVEM
jgi:hypothetical protein